MSKIAPIRNHCLRSRAILTDGFSCHQQSLVPAVREMGCQPLEGVWLMYQSFPYSDSRITQLGTVPELLPPSPVLVHQEAYLYFIYILEKQE